MFCADRLITAVALVSCLTNVVHAGKSKHTSHLTATAQQIARKQNLLYGLPHNVVHKNAQASLFRAVRENDIRTARLVLSATRHTNIDINKPYGFWQNTLLHTAVKKKSPQVADLLLRHPTIDPSKQNIAFGGPKTALDGALESGSHRMIKIFTRRTNFDPTQRDASDESTINKLAQRNKAWAESLCRYILKDRLKVEAKKAKKEKKNVLKRVATATPGSVADTAMKCMVCLETPQEILNAASTHPIDAGKKPEQLMSMTTCCHNLLCNKDKARWLNTSRSQNCPNCRERM